MNKELIGKIPRRALSYLLIFCIVFTVTCHLPYNPYSLFTREFMIVANSSLFTLLVWLTARLAKTERTALGVLFTAVFIFFFNTGIDGRFVLDDDITIYLASQCMVPFFIAQFKRIRKKNFSRGYFLMFLMGVFCSYTHNGVAIPLCATFLWLTWRYREDFFKLACWPMVIGFLIGTSVSMVTATDSLYTHPDNFLNISATTWKGLSTLWNTKVFLTSVIVTAYLFNTQGGRALIRHIARRHYIITACLIFSFISLPLAPLGIQNAVTGVCFFSMFWLLFIAKYMLQKYTGIKI